MSTEHKEPNGGRKFAEMIQEALKSPYGAVAAAFLVAGSILGTHYATSQDLENATDKMTKAVVELQAELQPVKDRVTILEKDVARIDKNQDEIEEALKSNQKAWHRIDVRIESIDGAIKTSNERLDHVKTIIRNDQNRRSQAR